MKEPRTVMITGASGFVGRPSLEALRARGFHVHAVARRPLSENSGVTWHSADLLDAQDRRRLIEAARPTHLLHLAWYVEHGRFWTAPENEAWVGASLDLLRLFAASGGRRAVLAGSCAEYDWNRGGSDPWRESDPCRPATPYGRAKLALLEQGAALAARTGVSFAWARFFLMFGFREDPRRLIPAMIDGLLRNEEVALSSGRQIRDLLDTRDMGSALAALVDADAVTGPVNVASGRAVSLRDAGRMLAQISERPEALLKFGTLADRKGEPPYMVADVSRLTQEAGFAFTHTLEQRLAECLDWHRGNMRHA